MRELVLGIDGGGTRTRAAIAEPFGRILATGEAGPSNFDDVGVAAARASLAEAVADARASAGFDGVFAAAFLGLAGVVSDRDRRIGRTMADELRLAAPSSVGVDHDCRIALAGALTGRPGVILIVGTGSSCYGRTGEGRSWRAGGWGWLISDEGSAYWMGREALTAAVRDVDGRGPSTRLTQRLLQHLGVAQPDDLMHRLYVPTMPRTEVAALAPVVTQAAGEGDEVARDIIATGVLELARCVAAVAERLDLAPGFELSAVGGLAQADETLSSELARRLAMDGVDCALVRPEAPPVVGACLLASELAARTGEARPQFTIRE